MDGGTGRCCMVLQGSEEGFSPPFDSSLYGASYSPGTPGTEYRIEYSGCDAVMAFFRCSPDVRDVLPEGVEPFSNPPQAGIFVTRYPFSTVGTYNEFLAAVQVRDVDGELAYYIPYIYVTNDAALAAGREWAGAPKKLADIRLERDRDVVQGTMDRPEDRRLLTLTAKPEERALGGIIDALLPDPTPLLSVRHVPPVHGGDGLTQLIEWYADIDFHLDGDGDRKLWTGPASLDFPQPSTVDPIHRLGVEEVIAGLYAEFDMTLGVTDVQKEWDL